MCIIVDMKLENYIPTRKRRRRSFLVLWNLCFGIGFLTVSYSIEAASIREILGGIVGFLIVTVALDYFAFLVEKSEFHQKIKKLKECYNADLHLGIGEVSTKNSIDSFFGKFSGYYVLPILNNNGDTFMIKSVSNYEQSTPGYIYEIKSNEYAFIPLADMELTSSKAV